MGLVVKFREGPRIVTVLPDVNLTLDIEINTVLLNQVCDTFEYDSFVDMSCTLVTIYLPLKILEGGQGKRQALPGNYPVKVEGHLRLILIRVGVWYSWYRAFTHHLVLVVRKG